jgi:tetratricopeptide (TPR) repeat protein
VLLVAFGCSGPTPPALPEPDMETAEEGVRRAVQEAQQRVREEPRSARAWGELGDRYRAESWFAEAAACYREAQRLEPSTFIWPYRLGKCLRLDDPSEAALALARALELDDDYPPAHLHYARTLVNLGRFDEAREHFEQARRLEPQSSAAYLVLGQLALSDGSLEAAREHLARALQFDPGDGRAHLAMAQVAMALGDREAADRHSQLSRRFLQNVPIEDPRDRRTVESVSTAHLSKRGKRLLAEGKPAEAESFLREAMLLDPDSEVTRLALGLALVMLGRPDEAEPQLREAVSLEPRRSETRSALGKFLLHSRNRPGEAEPHLREAMLLNPDDLDAPMNLGLALARTARLEEAEEVYREVVRRDPAHGDAHYRLGILLAADERRQEAEREFREALSLTGAALADPAGLSASRRERNRGLMSDAHSSLGYLFLEQGRVDEALRQFTEATGLRPSHQLAQLGLGKALAARGDRSAAEAAFRRALQLRPGWSEAARSLEELDVPP